MGWQDLLEESSGPLVAPWLGGRRIWRDGRAFRVRGDLPREFGWYSWRCEGRIALLRERVDPDPDYGEGLVPDTGYLVGDRLALTKSRVDPDPDRLIDQTVPVQCQRHRKSSKS